MVLIEIQTFRTETEIRVIPVRMVINQIANFVANMVTHQVYVEITISHKLESSRSIT